jgi:hypothetical protein
MPAHTLGSSYTFTIHFGSVLDLAALNDADPFTAPVSFGR